MNKDLLNRLSKAAGVKLEVRDNNKIMDVSADKYLEKIKRVDRQFSGRVELTEEEAMQLSIDKMYSRGNKVD